MKLRNLLLAIGLSVGITSTVSAQVGKDTVIRTRTSDPSTCVAGLEVYGNTSASPAAFRFCTATNIFTGLLINPMTTLGDVPVGGASGVPTRLISPTANGTYVLTWVVSGNAAVAPATGLPGVKPRQVTTTSDTILFSDRGNEVTYNNASSIATALPQANSTGFTLYFFVKLKNLGAGTVTVTPASSQINGTTSLAILPGQDCFIFTPDNTNYLADCHDAALIAGSGISLSRAGAGITVNSTAVLAMNLVGSANVSFATTPLYYSLGLATNNATEANVQTEMPQGGTATVINVTGGTIAAASTVTYTLRKNQASTALACTVAASTNFCTGTGTATFAASDDLDVMVTYTGTPGTVPANIAIKVTP